MRPLDFAIDCMEDCSIMLELTHPDRYVKPDDDPAGMLRHCPLCDLVTAMAVETTFGERGIVCAACGYFEHHFTLEVDGMTYKLGYSRGAEGAYWNSEHDFGCLHKITKKYIREFKSRTQDGVDDDRYLMKFGHLEDEVLHGTYERKAGDEVYARQCTEIAEAVFMYQCQHHIDRLIHTLMERRIELAGHEPIDD